jgi:S1-C subfamily serine protease
MQKRSSLGAGSILLVAVVALIFGAIAGAVAARATASNNTVPEVATSSNSNPASFGGSAAAPLSWSAVAQRVGPAVVTIINQQKSQTDIFGNVTPGPVDEGSGFVIDKKGDIVTNNHVIDNSSSLKVVFADGRKAPAQLVRADKLSDLAVVKVNVPVKVTLSWSTETRLEPGEPVLAIGSALGQFRNTVTAGVVSALGRSITEENGVTLQNMVQTDAAINQGNSGGPLLNDRGQVVAVNTAITRGTSQSDIFGLSSQVVAEGLGFAISGTSARAVVARLVHNKPPALLGVTYQQITPQDAAYYNFPVGAYVKIIKPGSPAAKAGVRLRDIITKIDNQSLNDTYQLEQVVAQHNPGQTITLTVWRSGHTLTLKAKLVAK